MHVELSCRCGAKAVFSGEQRESISLGAEVMAWHREHAAHNAAPALLDELEALRAENDRLRSQVEQQLRDWADECDKLKAERTK